MKDETETCLQPGMVVTDEPGVYLQDKFGIRTENVLLIKEKEHNADGKFLTFEPLTLVPIDLDAMDMAYLEPSDIRRLNEYHKLVFDKISPFMSEEERKWLRTVTAPLSI